MTPGERVRLELLGEFRKSALDRLERITAAWVGMEGAAASGRVCATSYACSQQPPWISTTMGRLRSPCGGRRSSPNCSGSAPYAMRWWRRAGSPRATVPITS